MSRRGKGQTAAPDQAGQDGAWLPCSAKEAAQRLFAKVNFKEHPATPATPLTKLTTPGVAIPNAEDPDPGWADDPEESAMWDTVSTPGHFSY